MRKQLDPNLSSKAHWQNMNNLIYPNLRNQKEVTLDIPMGPVTDTLKVANVFNHYFAMIALHITADLGPGMQSSSGCPGHSPPLFCLNPVTSD